MTNRETLPEQVPEDLEALLHYCWEDEEADFVQNQPDISLDPARLRRGHHIFNCLYRLAEWLNFDPAAAQEALHALQATEQDPRGDLGETWELMDRALGPTLRVDAPPDYEGYA